MDYWNGSASYVLPAEMVARGLLLFEFIVAKRQFDVAYTCHLRKLLNGVS